MTKLHDEIDKEARFLGTCALLMGTELEYWMPEIL